MSDELFDAPTQVSLQRQLEAARRELRMRMKVYPTRVANKHMTAVLAREETAAMAAIVDTLQRLVDEERARP
jgi:hypothetical protein